MKQEITLKNIFNNIRKGNRNESIEILYNSMYNKMYGIAFSFTQDNMISEDIIHNIIYKFMVMDITLFPTSSEITWLYKVIKNEALSYLKKERNVVKLELLKDIKIEDKNIEDYVELNKFYSIIEPLDEKRKEIVSLKILGDFTHKEIAQMTGKPIGTVQWLYNTSIKTLRNILVSIMSAIFILTCGLCVSIYNLIEMKAEDTIQTLQVYSVSLSIIFVIGILLISLIVIFIILYTGKGKKSLRNDKYHR